MARQWKPRITWVERISCLGRSSSNSFPKMKDWIALIQKKLIEKQQGFTQKQYERRPPLVLRHDVWLDKRSPVNRVQHCLLRHRLLVLRKFVVVYMQVTGWLIGCLMISYGGGDERGLVFLLWFSWGQGSGYCNASLTLILAWPRY